jgi:hypothetical protein
MLPLAEGISFDSYQLGCKPSTEALFQLIANCLQLPFVVPDSSAA